MNEFIASNSGTDDRIEKLVDEMSKAFSECGLTSTVYHPPHYNKGKIEVLEFIEDQKLNFHLGNVVKYVSRAEHKGNKLQDLKKALFYLEREIELIEAVFDMRDPVRPNDMKKGGVSGKG